MTPIVGLLGKAGCGKDAVADFLVERFGFTKMSLADEMKRFAKRVFLFTDQQLWGPSSCRNGGDERYNSVLAWADAEDRLWEESVEWCRFLFGPDRFPDSTTRLIEWFEDLERKYGPTLSTTGTLLSPRVVLQTIGTEFGRSIDPQVWVNSTLAIAKRLVDHPFEYKYSREEGVYAVSGYKNYTPIRGVVVPDCRFRNEVEGMKAAGGRIIRIKRPGMEVKTIGIAGHASEAEQDSIPDTDFSHVLVSPEGLPNLYLMLEAFIPNILRSEP